MTYRPDKQNTQPSALLLTQITYRLVLKDTQPFAEVDPIGSALSGQLCKSENYITFYSQIYYELVYYFICAGGFFMVQTQPILFNSYHYIVSFSIEIKLYITN